MKISKKLVLMALLAAALFATACERRGQQETQQQPATPPQETQQQPATPPQETPAQPVVPGQETPGQTPGQTTPGAPAGGGQ